MLCRAPAIVCFLSYLTLAVPADTQTQSSAGAAEMPMLNPEITKITVGFGPQGIAFTPGAIWVAYGNDKEFGVARIDASTNEVVARVPTGRWPVGAAAGDGSVWIVNRDDNTVTRIDPESNRILATIRVGRKPVGVELGDGSIWVTNSGGGTVSRIDPKTNAVTATIHVGAEPFGVCMDNGELWVVTAGGLLSHSGSLERIDPKSNAVTMKVKVPWSNVVFAGGEDVWVGTLQGVIIRIDRKSGSILKQLAPGGGLAGLAASKGVLWAVDNDHASLWKIDIQTNAVVGRVEVGNGPIIFGRGVGPDGAIWISDVKDGTVRKVKPN
jgi:virginiamycin B lyase